MFMDHYHYSLKTWNMDEMNMEWSWNNEGSKNIGYAQNWVKVFVSTLKDFPIICSPSCQFLVLNFKTGIHFVSAKDLEKGNILVSNPMNSVVKVVAVEPLDNTKPLPCYSIVNSTEYNNFYICAGYEDDCEDICVSGYAQ